MSNQISPLNEHKADFTFSYNEEMPHSYFSTMREVEYQIPENAKPKINILIDEIKKQRGGVVSILDLGCSYGVLSALIRFGLPLRTLYRRYQHSTASFASRQSETLWYASQSKREDVKFFGIDTSPNAIDFALSVGLLEGGVAVDLEDQSNTPGDLSSLPDHVDLIVSTGCVGYITEVTFNKVLLHLTKGNPPIIASFVLRAFDYSNIETVLAQHGFKTFKLPETTFVQRRFKDCTEQDRILSLLRHSAVRHDRSELAEEDGYYRAELFVSVHESADPSIFSNLRQIEEGP